MLGKTHFTVGIAAALVVTQPASIPGVVAAVAAGGIGGRLPDVDCKKIKLRLETLYDAIIDFLVLLGFLFLDFLSGSGMCQYVLEHWGIPVWLGLGGFGILLLVGWRTPHRGFTHSLLSLFLFSAAVFLFCQPALLPFFAGYASHLLIDLLNKRGVQLLFPLKWKPKLNLCDAGGRVNRLLFQLGFTADILMGSLFFASAAHYGISSWQYSGRPAQTVSFGWEALWGYLVFINLIAFFVCQRSHAMETTDYAPNLFDKGLPIFTAAIGGIGGMLLSSLLRKLRK